MLLPFLLLVMGAVDLGRAVFYTHMLGNAAREGARHGVVAGRTTDEICARALSALRAASLPGTPTAATCTPTGSLKAVADGGTTGSAVTNRVRVTLSYDFTPVTPLISQIVGAVIVLSASSTMYVEG